MEHKTGVEDRLVQEFLGQIRDWNVHGYLPEGLELADEKKVKPMNSNGFYDHGTDFGKVEPLRYAVLIGDLERKLKSDTANAVTDFPYKDGSVVIRYRLSWYSWDLDKRGEYTSANVDFLFPKAVADRLLSELPQNPELVDKLIVAKFPKLVENRKVKPWKKLFYLPSTVSGGKWEEQLKVISTRE